MSLAQFVGTAVVLGAAPAIVAENPENVEKLNLITFLMCLVLGLPSLIVRNKPPFPPSKSAASAELKPVPFIQGLKSLLTNSQFILMFIIFGVIIGAFECYVTLISDYVVPYGYTEADAGWLGITTIACGTVASILLGLSCCGRDERGVVAYVGADSGDGYISCFKCVSRG
ncbi:hypothetical protein BDR26DRAFT_862610 [Obelidium mucronatum]|nr:hypothetical protein BDR26DRAFT_862610 [Obelidium mucronatum]